MLVDVDVGQIISMTGNLNGSGTFDASKGALDQAWALESVSKDNTVRRRERVVGAVQHVCMFNATCVGVRIACISGAISRALYVITSASGAISRALCLIT